MGSLRPGVSEEAVTIRGRNHKGYTHRPLSSSCLGLPYRILHIDYKKERIRGLWVWLRFSVWGLRVWSLGLGFQGFGFGGLGGEDIGDIEVAEHTSTVP